VETLLQSGEHELVCDVLEGPIDTAVLPTRVEFFADEDMATTGLHMPTELITEIKGPAILVQPIAIFI
jgi:hypothetical protein